MTVIVEVRGVQAFGNGASDALDRAATHDRRCESSRTRLLRLHASGIVDLFLGRYASGIESFRAAVTLAEELRDFHMAAFELVYLGECHLYRGELKAARPLSIGWSDWMLRLREPYRRWSRRERC